MTLPLPQALARPSRGTTLIVTLAGCAVLLGASLTLLAPWQTCAAAAALLAAIVAGRVWRATSNLQLWHAMSALAVGGYIVLNYGFTNLSVAHVLIGHALMFAALGLRMFQGGPLFRAALYEPGTLAIFALIAFSLGHLATDVPQYGLYAVRDTSVFVEGIFLLLGMLWASDKRASRVMLKVLAAIFVVNFAYSLTSPWGQFLADHSPSSGVFLQVPLLGMYAETSLSLLCGAFFCLLIAGPVLGWPRWLVTLLTTGQLFGLAIHQHRSVYIALAVGIVALVLVGEFRGLMSILVSVGIAGAVLLLLTSVAGVVISGRVGPVNVDFLQEHVESLLLTPGTPAVSTIYDREKWYQQVFDQLNASVPAMTYGLGFGKPLINFRVAHGVKVRQPHNTNLTVLARLGVIGAVLWLLLHLAILWRFAQAFRNRHIMPQTTWRILVWLFLNYVFSLMVTSVQPYLEFSYGAIPFYFVTGFALGMVRWQTPALKRVRPAADRVGAAA